MIDDDERCYRAMCARDGRFDGWFTVGVTTTKIYCRPSCPARTPHRSHVRFYPSPAAAQAAGLRACKRCRPDMSPGSPEWQRRNDVSARAMRLIADGIVDRAGVTGLSNALGYSVRHLQRLLLAEVGAGPIALARAQRAQTARTLVETSDLPFTQVAFAAGFGSVRQFNDTVREVYATTPGALRARARRGQNPEPGVIVVRLAFRTPLHPGNLFGHLAATAVPGVEEVIGSTYRRTLRLPHATGIAALSPAADHVRCRLHLGDLRDLTAAITRCRWLLDLDADPCAVDDVLVADKALAPLVRAAPGRRVPRTVDGAELAIRAVLGQQVSTAAARTHAARLATEVGEPVNDPEGGLIRLFPSPAAVSDAEVAMPAARRATLCAVATALADGRLRLDPGVDRREADAQLGAIRGIGPWTRELVAMRALGDPDVLLADDLGVRRGASSLGLPGSASALRAHSTSWAPWRSYAAQHLWACVPHPINDWPVLAKETT